MQANTPLQGKLLSILPTLGDKKKRSAIDKLAKAEKVSYSRMYGRWYYTHFGRGPAAAQKKVTPLVVADNSGSMSNTPVISAKAGKGSGIQPYTLETGAEVSGRGSDFATAMLRKKLMPVLTAMKPYNVDFHTTPIYKTDRTTVRRMLNEIEKKDGSVFVISPIKDNKKMLRIYRKM